MSRIEYGDTTWRIHDHMVDAWGIRWIYFRRWGVDHDWKVRASVFGYPEPPQ